jgi:hypothetical protein
MPVVRIPATGGTPELLFQAVRAGAVSCSRWTQLCVIPEQTQDLKHIVVTAFDPVRGRGAEVARVELDREIDLSVDNLLCDLSPEGTRLAVARGPDGPIEIYSLRGQPQLVVPGKGLTDLASIKWAPDGKALFIGRRVKNSNELWRVGLRGEAKNLWKSTGPMIFGVPSPNGHYLAIYDWKQITNIWMMENF